MLFPLLLPAKSWKLHKLLKLTKSFNSIGSLSNDDGDGDGNGNGKKAAG